MSSSLDVILDRRPSECLKWTLYPEDVLPLWVADMDFRSPEPVIRALHERADHGIFGYQLDSPTLRAVLAEHVSTQHHLSATPDMIEFLPSLVTGLNVAVRAFTAPGDGVLVMPPVYPPFLSAVTHNGRTLVEAELRPERTADGSLRYHVDFEAFEAAITPQTRLFLLCNPHNPVGRVFTRAELERMAEICLRHNILICADEIHCNLLFDGREHRSIAGLAPEVTARTITLLSPSKAFNLPGLGLGFAVIADEALRNRLRDENFRSGGLVNVMGFAAALAAYREGWDWLAELLPYLQANRDAVFDYLRQHMPEIATTRPEGTYLAWLDCRPLELEGGAYNFFLERARVGLSDGKPFGKGGEGFLRLNFGCPRPVLLEALERMRAALAARP